jgi:hypothetical protein
MSQAVAPTISDRLLAAFRALVRAELPQLTYMGIYAYSIRSSDSSTISCDPVDSTIPLPSLAGVPLLPSVLGEGVTPPSEGACLVAFVNADPSRPVCISIDTPPKAAEVGDGTTTLTLSGGGPGVARLGDTVVAGIFAGTITSCSTKVTSG